MQLWRNAGFRAKLALAFERSLEDYERLLRKDLGEVRKAVAAGTVIMDVTP